MEYRGGLIKIYTEITLTDKDLSKVTLPIGSINVCRVIVDGFYMLENVEYVVKGETVYFTNHVMDVVGYGSRVVILHEISKLAETSLGRELL